MDRRITLVQVQSIAEVASKACFATSASFLCCLPGGHSARLCLGTTISVHQGLSMTIAEKTYIPEFDIFY